MKCFNHNDREAIGICISCKKALCSECLELVDNQVSCKNSEFCFNRSSLIKRIYEYNQKVIPISEKTLSLSYLRHYIILVIGLLFITLGLLSFFSCITRVFTVLTILVGLICIFISIKLLKSKSF